MRKTLSKQSGFAALSAVLILMGAALVISVGIGISGYIGNVISVSRSQSAEGFYLAELGVEDAMLRLARNKDFEDLDGYNLTVGEGNVNIVVDNDSPASGQATITSTATFKNKTRKVQVIVQKGICVGGSSGGVNCYDNTPCLGGGACELLGQIDKRSWEEPTN